MDPNILPFVNRYVGRLTSRNVIICTIFLFSMKKIPIRIPNPDSIRITKPYTKSLIGSCAQKVLISIFQHRCKFYLNGFKRIILCIYNQTYLIIFTIYGRYKYLFVTSSGKYHMFVSMIILFNPTYLNSKISDFCLLTIYFCLLTICSR